MHSAPHLLRTGARDACSAIERRSAAYGVWHGLVQGEFGEPVVLDVDGFDVRDSSPERVYSAAGG